MRGEGPSAVRDRDAASEQGTRRAFKHVESRPGRSWLMCEE